MACATNPTTRTDEKPADRVEAGASAPREKLHDAASCVAHAAEHAAAYVGQTAETAAAAVGSRLQSLSTGVREHMPSSGLCGSASSALADTLEKAGHDLQKEGLRGIAQDMTDLVRRNPIPALLLGVGVGFLVGRATTRRS